MDVKTAADTAAEYLKGFYSDAEKILLEEIELENDFWNITLSYEIVERYASAFMTTNNARKYKIFKIDSSTGQVLSMKIREFK